MSGNLVTGDLAHAICGFILTVARRWMTIVHAGQYTCTCKINKANDPTENVNTQ